MRAAAAAGTPQQQHLQQPNKNASDGGGGDGDGDGDGGGGAHNNDGGEPTLLPTASVALSAGQAVRVHGWWNPVRRLTWDNVKASRDLTFAVTLALFQGSSRGTRHHNEQYLAALRALHAVQPNVSEWIRAGKITLQDYEDLHGLWDVNPVTDFKGKIKIGEILQACLSCEALRGCNLTVDVLFNECGMTPENMCLFHFSLSEWLTLGLCSEHVAEFSSSQSELVFGVPKHTLAGSLRSADMVKKCPFIFS